MSAVFHDRDGRLARAIREEASPLVGAPDDYDSLLEQIGDARFVLLGEASHGTHEFYRERAEITKRLIAEKGFTAVAVEADWPDAYRVGCYARGRGDDPDAAGALGGFRRFPTWMWRNTVVRDFVEWLRRHNRVAGAQVGFYGLDLYSLYGSLEAVIRYLDKVDPAAARAARERYACFEHFGGSSQAYGFAAGLGGESCEQPAVQQLVDLQRRAAEYANRDGRIAEDEYFFAEQNARIAVNAEEYYRAMYRGRVSSWNLRDCHMAETLDELVKHLEREGERAKVAVWAHNSHLGDARATEMGRRGELNLGQLVRQRYAEQAVLVGFSTYSGTVTAAHDWDEPGRLRQVRPGLPGSYEELFHRASAGGPSRFLINLRRDNAAVDGLRTARLQRAIGVVYRPETERQSHYFQTNLPEQFDALLHFDQTRALEPLDRGEVWDEREAPETYPSADVPVGRLAEG